MTSGLHVRGCAAFKALALHWPSRLEVLDGARHLMDASQGVMLWLEGKSAQLTRCIFEGHEIDSAVLCVVSVHEQSPPLGGLQRFRCLRFLG